MVNGQGILCLYDCKSGAKIVWPVWTKENWSCVLTIQPRQMFYFRKIPWEAIKNEVKTFQMCTGLQGQINSSFLRVDTLNQGLHMTAQDNAAQFDWLVYWYH